MKVKIAAEIRRHVNSGKLELFTDFTKVGEISVKCLDFLGKLTTL